MSNESLIELPALTHPDAWDDPILFDEINTPEISASLLPGIYQQWILRTFSLRVT